jgi:hypothetical protein
MLLGNELFAGGGVKSGVMMKNKIMIEPNKAAQRRVHLAYARAFASLDAALNRTAPPMYTESEKNEIWKCRLFGPRTKEANV